MSGVSLSGVAAIAGVERLVLAVDVFLGVLLALVVLVVLLVLLALLAAVPLPLADVALEATGLRAVPLEEALVNLACCSMRVLCIGLCLGMPTVLFGCPERKPLRSPLRLASLFWSFAAMTESLPYR